MPSMAKRWVGKGGASVAGQGGRCVNGVCFVRAIGRGGRSLDSCPSECLVEGGGASNGFVLESGLALGKGLVGGYVQKGPASGRGCAREGPQGGSAHVHARPPTNVQARLSTPPPRSDMHRENKEEEEEYRKNDERALFVNIS